MSILVIHTGGTIGMVATPQGFAPRSGVVEDCINALSQSGALVSQVDLRLLTPLIDSANADPSDWTRVAQIIAQERGNYQGFVVTHGTDTLAYTAAALCFALEGLDVPVIVTGSMLPLSEQGSDGHRNLRDALQAGLTAPAGVWVQFSGQLMHGARVRKSHSTDFDAFRETPNATIPRRTSSKFRLHAYKVKQVAVLAMAPGLAGGLFNYAAENCDALLLRCYGSGTAPDTKELESALVTAKTRGIPVLAVSQCPEGGMALGTYASGAILRDNGVVDGRDMTVEAAYAKLQHVLSLDEGGIGRLAQSLCGEFTT
ncbi:asparaginase [Cognatishimia sp. WU-CL00825]|uniref:asparaginase n=1 Tax=Cognatishimia sp. WU-CL00825 TaxID=3127658 RepID=UPI00310379E6